jgi:hypothetical protein
MFREIDLKISLAFNNIIIVAGKQKQTCINNKKDTDLINTPFIHSGKTHHIVVV